MRVLSAFELKMRWRHFQQNTGWILGFWESVLVIVGGVVGLHFGIPLFFRAMVFFGEIICKMIGPS